MSAVQKFIASARKLHAEEKDPAKRWEKMTPLLQELIADPAVREQSKSWPDCSQSDRAAKPTLLRRPRLQVCHQWPDQSTAQVAHRRSTIMRITGRSTASSTVTESIERYERIDDRSKPDYADIRKRRM